MEFTRVGKKGMSVGMIYLRGGGGHPTLIAQPHSAQVHHAGRSDRRGIEAAFIISLSLTHSKDNTFSLMRWMKVCADNGGK